jgi:hypothetical protein
MDEILSQVQRELLPQLESKGLELLRYHGYGESEIVDLRFRNVRISIYREKGFVEVNVGPVLEAIWLPASVVASYIGCKEKDFASRNTSETVRHLRDFIISHAEQLNHLFSAEGFAVARNYIAGGVFRRGPRARKNAE